jgi:hypothetical protein
MVEAHPSRWSRSVLPVYSVRNTPRFCSPRHRTLIVRAGEQAVQAIGGAWRLVTYAERPERRQHRVLVKGSGTGGAEADMYVHVAAPLRDLLVDGGLAGLHGAMRRIAAADQRARSVAAQTLADLRTDNPVIAARKLAG